MIDVHRSTSIILICAPRRAELRKSPTLGNSNCVCPRKCIGFWPIGAKAKGKSLNEFVADAAERAARDAVL